MGYKLGSRSLKNLATCHPALQAVAKRAIEITTQDFTITEGFRGKEAQEAAFAAGNSRAHFGQSLHNHTPSLALDIVPWPVDWSSVAKFVAIATAFKQAAKELGVTLRWGGDFKSFVDRPHFEIDVPVVVTKPATSSDLKTLTPDLIVGYSNMLKDATIRPERKAEVMSLARKMADGNHWPRYEAVAATVGCPARLVALIHAMESGLSFSRHLHNGDPLAARTVQVPAVRPKTGKPPFTWEESAIDALRLHGLDTWDDWSRPGLAYVLERYNGWGYRRFHPDVPSPYLWSFTTIYTAGKYVADGHFDPRAVSKQAGAMALLIGLEQVGKPYKAEA